MTTSTQADVFQAIAAPIRREIIHTLAMTGEQSISALAKGHPSSRQAVTRHIQVLEKSGVVEVQKVGREQICHLNVAALQAVYEWVSFYQQFWDSKLSALEDYLDNTVPTDKEPK